MAGLKAVKNPEPNPNQEQARGKSGARFTYYPLTDSIAVARAIHEKAGVYPDETTLEGNA